MHLLDGVAGLDSSGPWPGSVGGGPEPAGKFSGTEVRGLQEMGTNFRSMASRAAALSAYIVSPEERISSYPSLWPLMGRDGVVTSPSGSGASPLHRAAGQTLGSGYRLLLGCADTGDRGRGGEKNPAGWAATASVSLSGTGTGCVPGTPIFPVPGFAPDSGSGRDNLSPGWAIPDWLSGSISTTRLSWDHAGGSGAFLQSIFLALRGAADNQKLLEDADGCRQHS